ncbi:MAG: hypothetical protein SGILL_003927 [Bacillariaceae sp.]
MKRCSSWPVGLHCHVIVFLLITKSPAEEKILSRATEKLNMSELDVEAGQFDKRSVENDNSLEHKKMMEVLLIDFESNKNKSSNAKSDGKVGDMTGSEDGSLDGDVEEDDDSSEDKEDNLNDLISNNENDYKLYKSLDKFPNHRDGIDTSLFTSEDDVPDWIKYPPSKKDTSFNDFGSGVADSGPRKRKEGVYDDGLSDNKHFMRLMDNQYDKAKSDRDAEESCIPRKVNRCLLQNSSRTTRSSRSPFIAINNVLRKLRNKLYANLQEYRNDWKLMFANAKQFNGDDSWVVEDGRAIEKELERVLKKNGFSNKAATPKSPPPKPKKKIRIKLSLKKNKDPGTDDNADDSAEPPK